MKVKFFAVLAALLMVGAVAIPASAQELTNDVIFLRVGYVPNYTVSFDTEPAQDDAEFTGFAFIGEYNLNLSPVLIGFGLEWQRVVYEYEAPSTDELVAQFLIPQVTAKFMTAGGFYLGAGLAGRYNLSNDTGGQYNFKKEVDLWVNGVIGYIATLSDGIYLDLQGRFGYNLTNSQWDKYDVANAEDNKADSAYDIAVYVGIGFKSFGTGL